jgi:4-hydroxy-tetrahydrodipicolinate reductase
MLRVVVSGVTGRMGHVLVRRIAESVDSELAGGIAGRARDGEAAARHGCGRIVTVEEAAPLLAECDALIDFSTAVALDALLARHGAALEGRSIVVGTTGLGEATEARLDTLAARARVLSAANFSIGVHVLARLVEEAARRLGAGEYDLEIVETHHRRKADAPSGTALLLGRAAARGRGTQLDAVRRDARSGMTGERAPGEIGFHAVRGGGVVGEHRVLLLGERERIELAHAALDRSIFAAGALEAAHWLSGRAPGRYTMADIAGSRARTGEA